MDKFYEKVESEGNTVTLKVTLPAEVVSKSYNELLQSRGESLNLKGFRKGKVPTNMIEPQMEQLLMTETFERLAPYYVNAAIMKEEIEPIAPPEYTDLENLKKGEDIVFKVKVSMMPEFKLGKISKIKVDTSEPEVKDEELQQTLEAMYNNNVAVKSKDGDEKSGIDDNWAKEIATLYQFTDVKDLEGLKNNLRDLLIGQKKQIMNQNRTTEIMKQAVKVSEIVIPDEAIAYEADQREQAFMQDLDSTKQTLADFLKERELTQEELKTRWIADAKDALENDVVLRLYAEKNNVMITDGELSTEVDSIKKSAEAHYQMEHEGHDHEMDFDESAYDNPQWQAQIKIYMQKQKAYKQLVTEVLGEDIFTPEPIEEDLDEESGVKKASKKEKDSKKPGKK